MQGMNMLLTLNISNSLCSRNLRTSRSRLSISRANIRSQDISGVTGDTPRGTKKLNLVKVKLHHWNATDKYIKLNKNFLNKKKILINPCCSLYTVKIPLSTTFPESFFRRTTNYCVDSFLFLLLNR